MKSGRAAIALEGRRIWVAGATHGLGRGVALELARRGARLALSGRDPDALAVLAAEVGARALVPLEGDDLAAHRRVAEEIVRRLGGLDFAFLHPDVDRTGGLSAGLALEAHAEARHRDLVLELEAVLQLLPDARSHDVVLGTPGQARSAREVVDALVGGRPAMHHPARFPLPLGWVPLLSPGAAFGWVAAAADPIH